MSHFFDGRFQLNESRESLKHVVLVKGINNFKRHLPKRISFARMKITKYCEKVYFLRVTYHMTAICHQITSALMHSN